MESPPARSPSVSTGLLAFASKAFRITRRPSSVASPRRMRRALFNSGRRSTSNRSEDQLLNRTALLWEEPMPKRHWATEMRGGGKGEEKGGGEKEKGVQGEGETRRRRMQISLSLHFPFSPSPSLLVPTSPCLPLPGSVALWLCGRSDGFVRETGDIFGSRDVSFRPRRGAAQPPLCGLVQRDRRPEGRRGMATDRMRRADRRPGRGGARAPPPPPRPP